MSIEEISTLVEEEVRTEVFYPFIDKASGGETIVEIGTFVGGNLCRVAQYIKDSQKNFIFYGVDNFHFANISNDAIRQVQLAHGEYDTKQQSFLDTLKKNLSDNGLADLVQIIDSDSIEASSQFEDESIDLLFIDGSHSYPYVGDELKVWIPKVKTGGIIAGHDWPCDGIKLGVKENLPNNKINITSTNGAYWSIK